MAILSKEDILKVKDVNLKEVEIPEWGGSVFIKPLTFKEKIEFDKKHMNPKTAVYEDMQSPSFIYDLLSLSIVDKSGSPIFTTEEIELLAAKNAKTVNVLFGVAIGTSFMSIDEVNDLKKK